MTSGRSREISYYRHHVELRVKLYMPREESFRVPLKYIDVTRNTHTSLDVLLEKNIDDYWNVDGDRELSDTWTRFTNFTMLKEKPPDGYTWSGERLTRKQTTSRPDNVWPDMWKHMCDASKRKAKQKWAIEKPIMPKETGMAVDESQKKKCGIQKPGETHSFREKAESRVRRDSKPDAASSSQVRLQDAYLGGLMDKVAKKPVATEENKALLEFFWIWILEQSWRLSNGEACCS